MALNSSTGNTIIGYTVKRLLEDELNPTKFPNQSYHTLVNQVFVNVNSWELFTTTSQKYSVQIPINKNVREAWDRIDQLTALGDKNTHLLILIKFGKSYLTLPLVIMNIRLRCY